jgi:prepilin-type processing-associated H-X9-DG protein
LGIALRLYTDDYRFYPSYYGQTASFGNDLTGLPWELAISTYYWSGWVTNRAYHCPAYTGGIVTDQAWLQDPVGGGEEVSAQHIGSYSYNLWGYQGASAAQQGLGLGAAPLSPSTGWMLPHRETDIIAPSEMFAIMDSRGATNSAGTGFLERGQWDGSDWTSCVAGQKPWADVSLQNPPQHGNIFNVGFCDGHVAAVRLTDLFNPTNTAQNWNVDHKSYPE